MKKIILAAALLAAIGAQAGTVGTAPNKSGGLIQLTDGTSKRCQELTRTDGALWQYVVTTTASGDTMKGCWHADSTDNQIEVRWGPDNDYRTSLYDMDAFTRTEYNARTYNDAGKPRRTSGDAL